MRTPSSRRSASPMGRSLDRAGPQALRAKILESLVQADRIGGGQTGVTHIRRLADTQRADESTGPVDRRGGLRRQRRQRLCQPPGRAGLAVGAGHGQHIQRLAGLVEPGRCDEARRRLEPLVDGDRRQGARGLPGRQPGLGSLSLDQTGDRTLGQGIRHKTAAIDRGARPGTVSYTHLTLPTKA